MQITRKAEKVESIIQAAKQEFLEKGFAAASMQNIANNASVSKRTLYKYYPSKSHVYNELIDMLLDSISKIYSKDYDPTLNIEVQLIHLIERRVKHLTSDEFLHLSRITVSEILKLNMPKPEQYQRFNALEDRFRKWIEQAKKNGAITSNLDSHTITEQFYAFVKGQVYWPLLLCTKRKKDLDLVKIQKEIKEFFLRSFCS